MSTAQGIELDSPPCDGVSALAFAAHANVLLVGSWDHHVRLYDVTLNKLRVAFKQRAPVLDVAFMDMDAAISGGVDTTVRLHHISTTLDEVLGSHDLPVKCVEHNTATGLVVSGGWDSTLRLWDARSPDGPGRCVGQLQLPGRVYAMATSNKRLVVATADKRIQIYDLRSLRAGAAPLQQRESPLKYQIRTLRCMPDGRGYAASSVEGRVALDFFDDAESTASRYAFKCHRRTEGGKETVYPVNALAFHPVHGTFATGGCDGYVNIWDGVAKKRLFVLPKYPSSIAAMSFNHDGTLLAIASSYTYEEGEKDHPPDAVYVRSVSDVEVTAKQLELSTVRSVNDVDAAEWDACASGRTEGGTNPFLSHGFMRALEDSGSVAPQRGWGTTHLLARDTAGTLLGVAPLYVKGHSYGEFVFDNSWASAYARNGARYYPKLQCCVPFTPVTGPRLLVRSEAPEGLTTTMAKGLTAVADAMDVSSVHVTFPTRAEADLLVQDGWMMRTGLQYHWTNRGYSNFADFEAALTQKRRKVVRQERKKAQEGLVIRRLRGDDIKQHHWDAFYDFYCDTADKKWGTAYLTREFFDLLGSNVGDSVMLMVAEEAEPGGGGIIAGALNLRGSEALFGRNWGCRVEKPFLHMELCYYQAIDEAIESKLSRVEAGAQGEHKMQRGYTATRTYSAHFIRQPDFRKAISDFLTRETEQMQRVEAELLSMSPYKDAATTQPMAE